MRRDHPPADRMPASPTPMISSPLRTSVYFTLLAEFGTGQIPLEVMCVKYFGLDPETAKIRAGRGELPVQPIRLAGQKSPWLVPADKLAQLIEKKMEQTA